MKRFFIYSIILLSTVACLSQEEPENQIAFLRGGNTEVRFSYYSQMISGHGLGMGYKSPQVWDVWSNPASMATFKQTYVSMNLMPPLWIDPSSYEDINKTIADELDDAIVDYRTEDTVLDYPTLGAKINHKGGLYGAQFVLPVKHHNNITVFSFDIGQPFYMNLTADNDGFETLIETHKDVGDQKKIIKIRMNALIQSELEVRATKYQFGLAQTVHPSVSLGLKIGQTRMRSYSTNEVKMDGIMETAGTEYVFNDPYDPRIDFEAGETNKLGQSMFADFHGSAMNAQFGALFKAGKSFVFGLDYDWQSDVEMTGNMEIEQYKIPGLNVDALIGDDEDGAEEEDLVDATQLDLAKLTLTKPIDNETTDHFMMTFPSSLGMQASYQGRSVETTLEFRKYFNTFGYEFLDETYFAYMNYGLNFIFSAGIFELALSGLNADLVQEKAGEETSRDSYWIPAASMKFAFFVAKQYQVSSMFFLAPTPGIGIKLGYFIR